MKKANLLNPLLATVVALTVVLVGSGSVFAGDDPSNTCSTYLEQVSGLSNVPCTPGTLSAILVFQPVSEDAAAICAAELENFSGLSNVPCTRGNLSAILTFADDFGSVTDSAAQAASPTAP